MSQGTRCDEWVRSIGGHLIYDAAIPVSLALFACWCVWLGKLEVEDGKDAAQVEEKAKSE